VSTFPGERHQLGYTKLLADASGPVIAKGAEAGEVVKAGQMIVTVALDDGADAVFDVPASLMRQVSPDVEITVALTDDPKIRTVGRVRETAPQADPVTRSYRVKVGLTGGRRPCGSVPR
jgi:multidrug efflux pump subunit AcrA (membrane-fusion protein)